MAYTVVLYDYKDPLTGFPTWWKKFIRGNPPGTRFNHDVTNDRLFEYSASYIAIHNNPRGMLRYLDFYDEQAYIWFMLRWA